MATIPDFSCLSASAPFLSSHMNVQDILSHDTVAPVCPPSPALSVASSTSSSASSASTEQNSELKRGWVAPFLLHLHQMLRRESAKIIRWTEDGLAFQILNKDTLTNEVLPRYFKNKNFASFQRQLNYFGFRKWNKARSQFPTYSREHFTRDNYSEMSLVKRQSKKSRKRSASSLSSSDEEQTVKRPAVQSYWISSDKCKPILPRPDESTPTMETTAPSLPSIWTAPVSSTGLFIMPPSQQAHFNLPVISPTRKVASGCKLPSIHDLSVSSALSARPRWLA